MKFDYLTKKKELVSVILLCVSAILVVSIFVKIAGFFTSTAKAGKIVKNASDQNTKDAEDVDKYFENYKKLADDLKQKNLFAPPEPKQHPVREVMGIFGDEVIIGNRLYKVGDRIGDAKIVSIEPTEVTIEWDGKKKAFSPMDAKDSSGPSGPGGPRPTASRGGPPRAPSGGSAPMVTVQSQGGPPSGGFGPGTRNSSRTEMQRRREEYRNMSEAERERFRADMRQRFGGRPSGGGRRGSRGGR